MNIEKTILADPVNAWIFSRDRKGIYLVGGYVRDLLRGQASNDRDFVLRGDVKGTALQASRKFKGTFIELKRNQTYRVALGHRRFIDFSKMKVSIDEDLSHRDFTINALAWSPAKGLIDPFNGVSDIDGRVVRVVAERNLADDPLRILRAFRIAAQLDFEIDSMTLAALEKHSKKVTAPASERITEEVIKIIMDDLSLNNILLCIKHKVLPYIMGIEEHVLLQNISVISSIDRFLTGASLRGLRRTLKGALISMLNKPASQGLNRYGILKLAILLFDKSKSPGYESCKLVLSNENIKKIIHIHQGYTMVKGRMTRSRLYEIFSASRDSEQEMALLIASQKKRIVDKVFHAAREYRELRERPLLDGNEIRKILGLERGRMIGQLKEEMERLSFKGSIKTKAAARHWLLSNLT